MVMENLLRAIRFERIEPGNYAEETLMGIIWSRGEMGDLRGLDAEHYALEAGWLSEREPVEEYLEAPATVRMPTTHGSRLYKGLEARKSAAAVPKKPVDIIGLEKILSEEFNAPITITMVKDLPQTRKQVREVFFRIGDGLSKVWVFKAEPEKTAHELTTYWIVYNAGVPTARPIGYRPGSQEKEYPYDIGILGGIVEHAGEPYNMLIGNMRWHPQGIFDSAANVVCLLADSQVRLTKAQAEFERYGIKLEEESPRKETRERFLAALGIKESDAEPLIKAIEYLHMQQSGSYFVSHGDTHTGNIVTISDTDRGTGMPITHIDKFGLIDWGSVMKAPAYRDALDFLVHHNRIAKGVYVNYDYPFTVFLDDLFIDRLKTSAEKNHLEFELPDQKKDPLIREALQHFYEMYDPARTERVDIETKATAHAQGLCSFLDQLEHFGYREQSVTIKKELQRLLNDKPYLYGIIN